VAFVTVEEVATRLGWPLTPDEQARVQAFIDDCTVLIEEYCGKDFERRTNQSFQLPAMCSRFLTVPRRYMPYLTVTTVAFEDGVPLPRGRLGPGPTCHGHWVLGIQSSAGRPQDCHRGRGHPVDGPDSWPCHGTDW
jgi:hypothetical protein